MAQQCKSCDTFVALSPGTAGSAVIFGKNSDRPRTEVQEVVLYPAKEHPAGSRVACTYIEIDQVPKTQSVILSRPAWLWGAEMGANEHGVCVGNEAVWDRLNGPDDLIERLLGMDLVRLGLERSTTAEEALDVMTSLLDKHGQGGPCGEEPGSESWSYHNSFLIADGKEAWVLETAGTYWAAERVTEGVRNISNELSIGTKFDKSSSGLIDKVTALGWYKPDQGPFNFTKVFTEDDSIQFSTRYRRGKQMLKDFSASGQFGVKDMMKILRDEESGICMTGSFCSNGSQVSRIPSPGSAVPACHWFTATPNPNRGIFKPFIFGPNAQIGTLTVSPDFGDEDPVKKKPRFQKQVDRRHELYKHHEKFIALMESHNPKGQMVHENLRELESKCLEDMDEFLNNFDESAFAKVSEIFKHIANMEMNFYK
ncbi:secernin-3-like isoform X2 [Gigantopelta aegis]|nr:secernin-3-like isoform X2 [Gigantopelta aegis]XP_041366484.1 secernin-3-like isoform X2 [Gigantopelta aegis]